MPKDLNRIILKSINNRNSCKHLNKLKQNYIFLPFYVFVHTEILSEININVVRSLQQEVFVLKLADMLKSLVCQKSQ